jgi:hypothetical protein
MEFRWNLEALHELLQSEAMKFAYLALYLAAGFGGFFLPDLVSEKVWAGQPGTHRDEE